MAHNKPQIKSPNEFWIVVAWCLLLLALLGVLASKAQASGCKQFFVQKKAVAIVAPVYAAPVYYQAGRDIEAEALAEKVARLVAPKIAAQLQAPQGQPVRQQVTASAFAKCIRCHGQDSSVVLDGSAKVSCFTYARWGQIAGQGVNVPPEMKKLVESLTPEEKGAVADAMLSLGAADKPTPVTVPPPEPGELR